MNETESQKSIRSLKVNERKKRAAQNKGSQQSSQMSSTKNFNQQEPFSQIDSEEAKDVVRKLDYPRQNTANYIYTQENNNDLSLNHLINASSIQEQQPINNQLTFPSIQQEEDIIEFSQHSHPSQKLSQTDNINGSQQKNISTDDVHSLLNSIKNDLQKVRDARQLMEKVVNTYSQRSRLQDQDNTLKSYDPETIHVAGSVQKKYNFLMKTHFHQTRDQLNSHFLKDMKKKFKHSGSLNTLERNNFIIREAYMLTKGREYMFLDLANDDMDGMEEQSNGDILFNRKNKFNESEQSIEITSIDIDLLTNDKRLHVSIPNYENHYRQYFENQEEFQENQELNQEEKRVFNKIYHEKSDAEERKVNLILDNLSECEKIDLLGKLLPEFNQCVKDLSVSRLKYNSLVDRVRKTGSHTFKVNLISDPVMQRLQIIKDLQKQEGILGKEDRFGRQKTSQNQHSSQVSKKDKDGKKSQEEAKKELTQMKEMINQTESKLKEVQLQRLQEKVKGFAATERQLKAQIAEFEQKDESLVNKIEEALCFGKVMFSSRAVGAKDINLLFNQAQYEFQLIPDTFTSNNNQNLPQGKATKFQQFLQRINESLGLILEREFDELFEEIINYRIQFQYKFVLLNRDTFAIYNDVHMLQESRKLSVDNLTFIDLGIVVKNNKENKKVFFFKVVHHNTQEKMREVFVMGIVEDQIYKWENSLNHTTDVTFLDKTYKLIKGKLIKHQQDGPNSQGGPLSHQQIDEEDDDDLQNTTDFNRINPDDDFSLASKVKNPGRKETLLDEEKFIIENDAPVDLNQIQQMEKDAIDEHKKSAQKLQELGLNIEAHPSHTNSADPKHFRDLSKIDDFGKVMSDVSMEVQKRAQQKHDKIIKEEKHKQLEKMRENQQRQQVYQEYAKSLKELELGTVFLKYGKWGQPKQKHVYLGDSGRKICWKDPGVATNKKEKKCLLVQDIQEIKEGRDTKNFKRYKDVSDAQIKQSFSLITKKRNLDLESPSIEDKQNFILHLRKVLDIINDPNFSKKGGIRDQILQAGKNANYQSKQYQSSGGRVFDSFLSGRKSPQIDNISQNQSQLK